MDFANTTRLDSPQLRSLFEDGLTRWGLDRISARVRYSRGADFSGTCIYVDRRLYINLGRHLRYPYRMTTNLAKVQALRRGWRRPVYTIELRDGYELAVFIFMHELYHLLVYRAGRNTRQKESMCDRFAARHCVDRFGCPVRDARGRAVARADWDFQDLDGFVSRRARPVRRRAARVARIGPVVRT